MLEVRNLYKRYTPKKGEPTIALNGISIKFPDTGLVFILGKSGSGKSTLLNVMGGLDQVDSGEIIIKDKSSMDFSKKDFDAYRNTYLGFIFQEYYILNEFTVGQNIALALQLQHKKATSEEINRILKEVDLQGFGNRKPNQLSGGQKQRVAIARALVKNPQIIFADEPTGALDSNTGIAIFDTLKKLSETKLVIVVSHDREFAQRYGDRVIELADGKVISDIEKVKSEAVKHNEGISIVDNKVIRIEKNYILTDADMLAIKPYLERYKNNILISNDNSVSDNVKHLAKIDKLGMVEGFKDTDEKAIVNKKDSFNTIKAKLPISKAFKLGTSSLRNKPLRLFLTMLLCTISFALFGFSTSVGMFSPQQSLLTNYNNSNSSVVRVEKNSVNIYEGFLGSKDISYSNYAHDSNGANTYLYFDEDDKSAFDSKYNVTSTPIYNIKAGGGLEFASSNNSNYNAQYYYVKEIESLIALKEDQLEDRNLKVVAGVYPSQVDEIAISKQLNESFKHYGYLKDNTTILPAAMNDNTMLNKYLTLDGNSSNEDGYKIVGIIDDGFDYEKYAPLKEAIDKNDENFDYNSIGHKCEEALEDGYAKFIFTNQQTLQSYKNKDTVFLGGSYYQDPIYSNEGFADIRLNRYKSDNENYVLKSGISKLESNQTLLDYSTLRKLDNYRGEANITYTDIDNQSKTESLFQFINNVENYQHYIESFANENYDKAVSNNMVIDSIIENKIEEIKNIYSSDTNLNYSKKMSEADKLNCLNYIMDNNYQYYFYSIEKQNTLTDYYHAIYAAYLKNIITSDRNNDDSYLGSKKDTISLYDTFVIKSKKSIYKSAVDSICDLSLSTFIRGEKGGDVTHQFTFAGVDLTDVKANDKNDISSNIEYICFVLSDELFSTFLENSVSRNVQYLETSKKDMSLKLSELANESFRKNVNEGDIIYRMNNSIVSNLDNCVGMVSMLALIFVAVAIVFLFISIMLFINYISISIDSKRKEIGILRAIGAKSSDVFKIFFSEAFVIALITGILAIVLTFVGIHFFNIIVDQLMSFNIANLFTVTIINVLIILAVGFLTGVISTLIPTSKIAKKNPIDAIQDKKVKKKK